MCVHVCSLPFPRYWEEESFYLFIIFNYLLTNIFTMINYKIKPFPLLMEKENIFY